MRSVKREMRAVRIGGAYSADAMSEIRYYGASGKFIAHVMQWSRRSRPGKALWMI
jgi:hypothetical protein